MRVDAQPADDKQPVKRGDDLAAIRKKCKNSILTAAVFLCKDGLQVLCRIIYTMISVIRREHGKNAHEMRGPESVRGWYVAAAKGRVLDVSEKTCAQLQSSSALEYMGFTTDFGRGLPGNLSETHDMVKEEDDKGRHAMGIFLSVARHRLGSMMWHFCSWVGLLALAASNSETDVDHCIDVLRLHYRVLFNAVVKAKQNPFLQKVVNASPFKTVIMQDVAEMLCGHNICAHGVMKERLKSYAKAIFRSWGQTKVVEDNFQRMRTRETGDSRHHQHTALSYWAMARDMKAIELHDREQVNTPEDPDPCAVPNKFDRKDFKTAKHTIDIPGSREIMGKATWPTFSAQTAQFQYASSHFLQLLNAKVGRDHTDQNLDDGNEVWDMASRAWRGAFFKRGMIVQKKESGEYYTFLGLTGNLLVSLWKVTPIELQRKGKHIAFAVGTGENYNEKVTWASPIDLDDYEAVPCDVLGPAHLYCANGKRRHGKSGVVFLQTEDPLPPIVHAAWNCFWRMPKHELATLCAELDVQPTQPDILGAIEILLHTILPDCTQEQYRQIIEKRCEVPKDPLLEFADPDVLEAMFPEDDAKIVEDL